MAICGECQSEISIFASRCPFCISSQPSITERAAAFVVVWSFVLAFFIGIVGLIVGGIIEILSPIVAVTIEIFSKISRLFQ